VEEQGVGRVGRLRYLRHGYILDGRELMPQEEASGVAKQGPIRTARCIQAGFGG
jgi:hypothetical protein